MKAIMQFLCLFLIALLFFYSLFNPHRDTNELQRNLDFAAMVRTTIQAIKISQSMEKVDIVHHALDVNIVSGPHPNKRNDLQRVTNGTMSVCVWPKDPKHPEIPECVKY